MSVNKIAFTFPIILIVVSYISYQMGVKAAVPITIQKPEESLEIKTDIKDENIFPSLSMPIEYFDASDLSIGAGSYSVIHNSGNYQSYPSTTISLKPEMYSNNHTPLPPIKTDEEIHGTNPEIDFMGTIKSNSVKKYGDLARRFVGSVGEGWEMYKVEYVDVNKDGENETIVSLSLMGANVIGQRNVIIKDENVVFSTDQSTFSTLTAAKNNNGFFLQWDDNFKNRDGHMMTRFIFDGDKFVPVYEQQTRYIRLNDKKM